MGQLRIILGGATQQQMRALILARADSAPNVTLTNERTRAAVPFSLTRVPQSNTPIRATLDARGVQLYLVHAQGLAADTPLRLCARTRDASKDASLRTLPRALPAEGITVAVASCYYDGYHRDAALRAALARPRDGQAPLFHLWVGDNLYLDVPADSSANQPHGHTVDRYLRYFLDSGYADVRALAPSFTTYDDHEFWNNYPETVPWLSRTWAQSRDGYQSAARDCVALFQSSLNPSTGDGTCELRIDPLSFFMLDTRTFRERLRSGRSRTAPSTALAKLEAWVDGLTGPGVLVLGQPLWIGPGGVFDRNLPAYQEQYAALWACVRRAPFDLLVISGDVHHSRMLRIAFRGADNRRVFELVTSPACHIPKILSSGQGQGDLGSVPDSVQNASQAVSASSFFGTDASNTFGLLRFTPLGRNQVRVGVSMVDCMTNDYAVAKAVPKLPRATQAVYPRCHEPTLCVLRER